MRRVTCDAVHSCPRITAYDLAPTIWQIVHPLRRREACEHGPMLSSLIVPLIRRLHSLRYKETNGTCDVVLTLAVPAVPLVTTVGAIRM